MPAVSPIPDVDAIIRTLEQEAARRNPDRPQPVMPPLPVAADPAAGLPADAPFQPQSRYTVADFLIYQDERFIRNAYLGILGRSPDPAGLNDYRQRLRSGQLSRIGLLIRLRYSPEGRRQGRPVRGLLPAYAFDAASRLPLPGYPLALLATLLRLPMLTRDLQQQTGQSAAQLTEWRNRLAPLLHRLESGLHQLDQQRRVQEDRLNQQTITQHNAIEQMTQRLHQLDQQRQTDEQHLQDQQQRLQLHEQRLQDQQQWLQLHEQHRQDQQPQLQQDRDRITQLQRRADDYRRDLLDQERRLKLLLAETRKRLPAPLDPAQLQSFAEEEAHLDDAWYLVFEDAFRGTRAEIKQRLQIYLPVLDQTGFGPDHHRMLDLGCGRGEWLETVREAGFNIQGIDLNRRAVEDCRDLGLPVIAGDALAYLREQPSDAFSAITAFHLIEHVPLDTLIGLLDETLRTLRPGGLLIVETPNPRNILVGAGDFYRDPTHRNPVFPDTLAMLAEARGFINSAAWFFSAEGTLQPAAAYRFDTLDDYLNVSRDFAWIGYKA